MTIAIEVICRCACIYLDIIEIESFTILEEDVSPEVGLEFRIGPNGLWDRSGKIVAIDYESSSPFEESSIRLRDTAAELIVSGIQDGQVRNQWNLLWKLTFYLIVIYI